MNATGSSISTNDEMHKLLVEYFDCEGKKEDLGEEHSDVKTLTRYFIINQRKMKQTATQVNMNSKWNH